MSRVKVSVSLSEEDLAVLDDYARSSGLPSRSAAVQQAIRLLRHRTLEDDYAAAWDEWNSSVERQAWEATTGDGVVDETR